MKGLWLRVEAHEVDSKRIGQIAQRLGIPAAHALGLYVALGGAVAEHAPDGTISDVPDDFIERWASWGGRSGRFAAVARDVLQDADGRLVDWLESMGKLVERREKEKTRKNAGKSSEIPQHRGGNGADIPQDFRAVSGATERNGTERNGTKNPASSSPLESSKRRSGDLERERARENRTAAAPPADAGIPALPRDAIGFVNRFYGESEPKRHADVVEQLVATLHDGARFKRAKVTAGSPERLAAKCREVLDEGVRDPDKAIVVLLTKLNDSTDVTTAAVVAERTEIAGEDRNRARELVDANAWLEDHADVEAAIVAQLDREFPIGDHADIENDIYTAARRIARESLVLAAYRIHAPITHTPIEA